MAKGFVSLSDAIKQGLIIDGEQVQEVTPVKPTVQMSFPNKDGSISRGPKDVSWKVSSSSDEQWKRARNIGIEVEFKKRGQQ